jgi:hypothetical protein
MRVVLLALSLLLCASAAAAEPPQCRNLNGRIAHYETMLDRAKAADSDLWESRLGTQIGYLKNQRKLFNCPDKVGALEIALKEARALLKLAAQGALTFFTMGAM